MNNETKCAAITKSLWLHSAMISKHLDNSLGAIHGIGLTEYMVLQSLMEAPDKSLRRIDLAEALGRTASGVTRMLMPMEKIGLVVKESSSRDARVSLVRVTAAGEEIFSHASTTLAKRSESLLKNLNAKETDGFLKLLQAI